MNYKIVSRSKTRKRSLKATLKALGRIAEAAGTQLKISLESLKI